MVNPQKIKFLYQVLVKIFNFEIHTFFGSGNFYEKANSFCSRECNGELVIDGVDHFFAIFV